MAKAAPLRSVMVPRVAVSGSVRTKRWSPSFFKNACCSVCKYTPRPTKAINATLSPANTNTMRPLVVTGLLCLGCLGSICGL